MRAFVAAMAVTIAAVACGCGKAPATPASGTIQAIRAPVAGADTSSAGSLGSSAGHQKPGCVGLGCEGDVAVGTKEGCVGMGCLPADEE